MRRTFSFSSSSNIKRSFTFRGQAIVDRFVRFLTLPRLIAIVLICTVLVHRSLSFHASHRSWAHAPVTFVERQCPAPSYETLIAASGSSSNSNTNNNNNHGNLDICLTTLTDEKSKSWQTKYFGWRNFDGLLALTWDNKMNYARKHGYRLFDESDQLDRSRPASWSKIRAVQRLLREEGCDWVFWLDADTVVMNSNKKVEDFLPINDSSSIDILLSPDDGGGYNAGVWLVRNTEWTRTFLQEWWDMKTFVKPPGLAKSGDNDALKHKTSHMSAADLAHLAAPPRCTFNSFARFVQPNEYDAVEKHLKEHDWYLDEASYHKGDLIAHVAGVDNKVETIKLLLEEAV